MLSLTDLLPPFSVGPVAYLEISPLVASLRPVLLLPPLLDWPRLALPAAPQGAVVVGWLVSTWLCVLPGKDRHMLGA